MKQTTLSPTFVPNAIRNVFGALLVIIPFHAFLTVFGAEIIGHYTLLRVWPEVIMMVLVVWFVAAGIRDPSLRQWLRKERLAWFIAAYAAVIILWTVGGVAFGQARPYAALQGFLIDIRLPLMLGIGFVLAHYRPSILRRCPKYLLWPLAIVVVFGLLQAFVLPQNFLAHFGYGPHTIPAFGTIDQKIDYQRVQSFLRGANPLGAYLALMVPIIIVSAKRFKSQRWWLLLLLAATLVALVFTYSRSAYLGAAVGVFIASFGLVKRQRGLWAGLATVILVVILGTIGLRHNDKFQNTFFHTDEHSTSATSSNANRAASLEEGFKDVMMQPLGHGVGTAGPASANNDHPTRIAENYYLQIGQEMGWLGLGLFALINIYVVWRLWVLRQEPTARALLAAFFGLGLVNMLSHAWADETLSIIWWGVTGLAMGASVILIAEQQNQIHEKTRKKISKASRA